MKNKNYSSLQELTHDLNHITNAITKCEPEEIRLIRMGQMRLKAGSYGQYFGLWDVAHGMLRDYSALTLYQIVRIAEDENVNIDTVSTVLDALDTTYSNYLRYSGFPQLGELAETLRCLVKRSNSRSEIVKAIRAYTSYTNRLYAWAFHYFPWGIGEQFKYEDSEEIAPVVDDINTKRLHIKNGQRIRIAWEPLGISVDAVLASNENPELCAEFASVLPFSVLQEHAVVTGKSIYAWVPVISTAPISLRERICDAPIGRIRFSQISGQKIIVQYGPTTEDLAQPVLGEVIEEHKNKLSEVGRLVWESTYKTKKLIWVNVQLLD